MKTQFLSIVILFFSAWSVQAQSSLPASPRKSAESYIYAIGRDNLRKIYLKDDAVSEEMLGHQIAKYTRGKAFPTLKKGNYVIVEAIENQLNFTDLVVDDFYFKHVSTEKIMLCLYDSLGNMITDAIVKCGSKTLPFNKQTQTYNGARVKNEQVIEVNNRGVYHYIEIESSHYDRHNNIFTNLQSKVARLWHAVKTKWRQTFDPDRRYDRDKYTGFIVFNKPQYKPNETVKLKAYMADMNGKPYNKPVRLRLCDRYSNKLDTTLTKSLAPYRPGMYEYQFKLTDSLNLRLDNFYNIDVKTKNEKDNYICSSFKYEDYELKSIRLLMTSDKPKHVKGDSVNIKLKVSDENEMALYGGKAEIYVIPQEMRSLKSNNAIFIPDTLWQTTIEMSDVSEKTVTLPQTIFPSNTSLRYKVNCTYLAADNEKKTATQFLYWDANDYVIDFSLSKGMLTIKQLHDGGSCRTEADIFLGGENGETLSHRSVILPYTLLVPWNVSEVSVKTKDREKTYSFDNVEREEQLGYKFYRGTDSIYLKVENPASIPFWYTISGGKGKIVSGYTASLDYSMPDKGKEGYNMQLSYLFAGECKHIEQSLPYVQKNITLDVSTPTVVYPGQKAKVLVSVTDRNEKPVKDVDITAYSFTSKFDNSSMPSLQVKGNVRYAKSPNKIHYTVDESGFTNRGQKMNWETWKTTMVLDTIEYYKFLYPDTFYRYTEKTPDGTTQLLPYVVLNGVLQGMYMLWIDERLYYTNLAQQMEVYAFPVDSGKHDLRIRTYDREIKVHNVFVEEGAKNIFSFNVKDTSVKSTTDISSSSPLITSRLLKKKEWGILSDEEVNDVSSQLITVDNNFGTVELPNGNKRFDLPVYIHSGNTIYYLNSIPHTTYDYTLRTLVNSPILVGPFPTRSYIAGIPNIASLYADRNPIGSFEIEARNRYTLYDGYQKIKSWQHLPFNKYLNRYTPVADFKQELLTPEKIYQHFDTMVRKSLTTLTSTALIASGKAALRKKHNVRLNLSLGKDVKGMTVNPSLIFITSEEKEQSTDDRLYYGGTRKFRNLPQGKVVINLIFNDSLSFSRSVVLHPNGENYLNLDSIEYQKNRNLAFSVFELLNRNIKKEFKRNPYANLITQKDSIVYVKATDASSRGSNAKKNLITGQVLDSEGMPIIGASIGVVGASDGTVSNYDGQFTLKVQSGSKIRITYIGFRPQYIECVAGGNYEIVMEEDAEHSLAESVVVGYGIARRGASLTRSLQDENNYLDNLNAYRLQGKLAGLKVRGVNSFQESQFPLIILNGLPFDGKLEDLDATTISSMNILKDASMTPIYGSRAANGVIMIQTNAGLSVKSSVSEANQESVESGASIRRNFRDDAFWQPRLRTDEKGEVSFEVTYPDDITSWNAYFIAVGDRKQTDKKQMTIKSFKALTARLSMPRFAVRGDSLTVVGRVANHMGDSVQIIRKTEIHGQRQSDDVKLGTSHVDYIPLKAENGDSLSVAYSLQMQNGYFDGEQHTIPVLEQGLLQADGDFKIINDSEIHQLRVNPSLGTTTVYAEASGLNLLLREIEKVSAYPYMCNEQMASKIKALLSKKHILKMLNKEFKEDRKIKNLIAQLNKNKNSEGFWGWWNRNKTEFWVSKQVLSAMLDAEEAGYKVDIDKRSVSLTVEEALKNGLSNLQLADKRHLQFAKGELLEHLLLLKRMNAPVDYQAYFKAIDSSLKNNAIDDRLKTMYAMSVIGLCQEINTDSLMKESRTTLLGGIYWGGTWKSDPLFRMPTLPYENNIENTLMAYTVLKNIGGAEEKLLKIRNYFFENRDKDSWKNTYESSRIIETIMPDMLKKDESFSEVSMYIDGKKVKNFPYTETIEARKPIEIRKEGSLPLFVTAYQQAWNKQPVLETKKGFTINSYFKENKDTVSTLTTGKIAQLEIVVNVDADANYVQIEIPIPAGCSYENKISSPFVNEAHREYFKEKVVIFSNKLTKGEHRFSVNLIARYSGKYHLNPAKAELMYFPSFYGNEKVKIVDIR